MTNVKKFGAELKSFFLSVSFCLTLSWKTSKIYTFLRITLEILTPLLTIVASFVGKYVLDLLSGMLPVDNSTLSLILFSILLLSIVLSLSAAQKVRQYCTTMHDEIISGYLSYTMLDRCMGIDIEYFDDPVYYDKIVSVSRDQFAIANMLWNTLSLISAGLTFIGVFIVLCEANILYGFSITVAAIPSSIITVKYAKSLYNLSIEQTNGERQKSYYMNIATDKRHAQTIRLFDVKEKIATRYKNLWTKLFKVRKVATRRRTILTCILDLLPELVVSVIGIHIGYSVLQGHASIGDYSFYTGLVSQLWSSIAILSSAIMNLYDNKLKINNIKSLDAFTGRTLAEGNKSLTCINTIEFKHVSFIYPGTEAVVLDDINLSFNNKEKVALVGQNGSGKSTLVKLLLRFYDPCKGVIQVNGVDIKEYKLMELRNNFSVYFQDMQNFSFTLRENINISNDSQDNDDEAFRAVDLSLCTDIVNKSSKGLDTYLTKLFHDDGIELSGGQNQRVALARTFYRQHNALILDEPSSSLDPQAEHDILMSIKSISSGKMTIITSHRLTNLSLADRIIVMEKGKVVEDGSQAELIKSNGKFAELFRYQQELYHCKGS